MQTQVLTEPVRESFPATCGHKRLIDDVLTRGGRRTGKVRCLECGAIFDDPYRGLELEK